MKKMELKNARFGPEAKSLVDLLFDKGLLHPDLSRDDINAVEELVRFNMDSKLVGEWNALRISEIIKNKAD